MHLLPKGKAGAQSYNVGIYNKEKLLKLPSDNNKADFYFRSEKLVIKCLISDKVFQSHFNNVPDRLTSLAIKD